MTENVTPIPKNIYGVTKVMGESLCDPAALVRRLFPEFESLSVPTKPKSTRRESKGCRLTEIARFVLTRGSFVRDGRKSHRPVNSREQLAHITSMTNVTQHRQ